MPESNIKKKKILIHSDYSKSNTGFGKNARVLLNYLFETGRYDIVEYGMAPLSYDGVETKLMPWKTYGAVPTDPHLASQLLNDPVQGRATHYGAYYIDKIIEIEKPDVYIGIQDPWAFNGYWDKPWWNKFPCILWTTLDSLPPIDIVLKNADKIENFWSWADFATQDLHERGFPHVKTVRGVIDNSLIKPLNKKSKERFRRVNNIDDDCLIFGFVFRNQLRKLVGSLIESFSIFKERNPDTKAKLLLHTYWEEGWKIRDFIKEFKVDPKDVLTTYICHKCKKIEIKPDEKQGANCPHCKTAGCQTNPRIDIGCSESDLNEVYNLMDAYIHPMTSGGLELPILEAMLSGLPTATVPYSCGTEYTESEDVFPIEFNVYRELESNFKKAQSVAESIVEFMEKIKNSSKKDLMSLSKRTTAWAKKKFDSKKTLEYIDKFITDLPDSGYDFVFAEKKKDASYPYKKEDFDDDKSWLLDLYQNCLDQQESEDSDGMKHWLLALSRGAPHREVYDFFIKTANEHNAKVDTAEKSKVDSNADSKSIFKDTGKLKLCYVMPKSYGDCFLSTAILESLLYSYPLEKWDYYVSCEPQYVEIFKHLDFIKDFIGYTPELDNFRAWEGDDKNDGMVDVVFQPYLKTQRLHSYTHNGIDVNELQKV